MDWLYRIVKVKGRCGAVELALDDGVAVAGRRRVGVKLTIRLARLSKTNDSGKRRAAAGLEERGLRLLKASSAAGWMACGMLSCLAAPGAGLSKPGAHVVYIPVEPLGFKVLPTRFISTGSTMLTLHFVDEQHLLFTFTVRGLMPRLADQEPDDEDRTVRALLLEVPSGRVLAKTEWRTRDRDRYLWPLDHGRFLLRVRSKFTVLDPVRNLAAHGEAEAFHEQPLLEFKRRVGYLSVSPGGDVLGVELLPARKPKLTGVAADAAALASTVPGYKAEEKPGADGRSPVQIYFYRLKVNKEEGGRLVAAISGNVGAPNLISLPATGEGYLDIKKESSHSWLFDFVTHSGKRLELSAYDTSCAPRPFFVSRSEFVAFGCRGSSDRAELSFFNLKGEEPWVSALSGTHVSPMIISAPESGRFALSRTLVNSAVFDAENLTTDDMTAQEITVFQGHDGRILLTVQASPIQRMGQNFDLSPSGGEFAVLKGSRIEVHSLPEANGADRKAVEMAHSLVPEVEDLPVRLNGVPVRVKAVDEPGTETQAATGGAGAAETKGVGQAEGQQAANPVPAASVEALPAGEAVKQSSADRSEGALGDSQEGTRKKPSLYSAEHPVGKDDPKSDRDKEKPHQER